jgi:hypothetical protein
VSMCRTNSTSNSDVRGNLPLSTRYHNAPAIAESFDFSLVRGLLTIEAVSWPLRRGIRCCRSRLMVRRWLCAVRAQESAPSWYWCFGTPHYKNRVNRDRSVSTCCVQQPRFLFDAGQQQDSNLIYFLSLMSGISDLHDSMYEKEREQTI